MIAESALIAKKYRRGKLIGRGAFGDIYSGLDVVSGVEVAIKVEIPGVKRLQIMHEAKVYRCLQGGQGIPKLYWSGEEAGYKMLIMERLGPSLEDLFCLCKYRFFLPTVVAVAEQLISCVENFHENGFLHRDIKPDNFVVDREPCPHTIYIIDYGLAKPYRDPKTKTHIPFREGKKLTGTARYASIYTHQGYEQSRRDDLECLGYVLVYFAQGQLPWQGMRAPTKERRYENVMSKKTTTPIETLCKGLPVEFAQYIAYSRSLKFEDRPDYARLRRLFAGLYRRQRQSRDFDYDWNHMGVDARKIRPAYKLTDEEDDLESPKQRIGLQRGRAAAGAEDKDPLKRKNTVQSVEVARLNSNRIGGAQSKEEVKQLVKTRTILPKSVPRLGSHLRKEEDSCNFEVEDILEDVGLFEETIPDEKSVPTSIMLPTSSYINNTRHFYKNRAKKDGEVSTRLRMTRTMVPGLRKEWAFRRAATKTPSKMANLQNGGVTAK